MSSTSRSSNYQSLYGDHQEWNKLSDESYASARTHQSELTNSQMSLERGGETPKKQISDKSSTMMISASASKVIHNKFLNLKKFFRNMPSRRSLNFHSRHNSNNRTNFETSKRSDSRRDAETSSVNLDSSILSDYFLNQSQSPPVCPPPPQDLKFLSYMENPVNYSNYDEFTKMRNERPASTKNSSLSAQNDDDDDDSHYWQLTSLPACYERNLTTVVEERQRLASTDLISCFRRQEDPNVTLLPPAGFENPASASSSTAATTSMQPSLSSVGSTRSSSSLATTDDSILDYNRQNGTSFRFSYAQPRALIEHDNNVAVDCATLEDTTLINNISTSSDNHTDADETIVAKNLTSNGSITYPDSSLQGVKIAELESTIDSLKDKLLAKEKELTDLQLKLWSSDYLNDQLKSKVSRLEARVSRLEKENSNLNSLLADCGRATL